MFSPELKKGGTEMLTLALVGARPRHGYEIGKLIEARSGGRRVLAQQRATWKEYVAAVNAVIEAGDA